MTERKVLQEKYRLASNLKKGMEVQTKDGDWVRISMLLRIYSPMNFVTVDFESGGEANFAPKDRVMSR